MEPTLKKPRLADVLELCPLDVTAEAAFYRSSGRKKPPWTPTEQAIVAIKHCELGNRWTQIAAYLPLRSENDVKNIWHSTLRCKDTQKRSFLRTYALAVHDNAYDYTARKAMFDMAVRQCGPPPQQATDLIARMQVLLDNPELQAAIQQEHLQQQEQLLAVATQQQAVAQAAAHAAAQAAAAAQAHAAQMQMHHQHAAAAAAAANAAPNPTLLMLLRQAEQQQLQLQMHQQERQQRGSGDGDGSGGDGGGLGEDRGDRLDRIDDRLPAGLPSLLQLPFAQLHALHHHEHRPPQLPFQVQHELSGDSPAKSAFRAEDKGRTVGLERLGDRGRGADEGEGGGPSQGPQERRFSPRGDDVRPAASGSGTGDAAGGGGGGGEAAGPQLTALQALQLVMSKAQAGPPSPSPTGSASASMPPPPPTQQQQQQPRMDAAAGAGDAREPQPRLPSEFGTNTKLAANGSSVHGGGVGGGGGGGAFLGKALSTQPSEALIAHLAAAAAAAAGPTDGSVLASLTSAKAAPVGAPFSRSAGEPQLRPQASQLTVPQSQVPLPGADSTLGLIARCKADALQAGDRQLGTRPGMGGDERERETGLAGRLEGGQAEREEPRGGKAAVAAAAAGAAPQSLLSLLHQLELQLVAQGPLPKAEPEEAGAEIGSGAKGGLAAPNAHGAAAVKQRPRDGGTDTEALPTRPRAGAQRPGHGVGRGGGGGGGRDGGAHSLEDADSDEMGAVEALALAARMHAQQGRAGAPGGAAAAGPAGRPSSSGRAAGSCMGRPESGGPSTGANGTGARVSGFGGPGSGPLQGPVLDLQSRGPSVAVAPALVLSQHQPQPQQQPGRVLSPLPQRPRQDGPPQPPQPLRAGGKQAAPPAQARPATAVLDVVSLLNVPSQRQHVLSLPAQGLATLLCAPSFGVDCEASVLLLLAEWRATQAAASGVSKEHLRVLCSALRLAALGSFHLSAVLPHLLAAPTEPRVGGGGAAGASGRWFDMRPEEMAFLLRYIHAGETERAHLADAAAATGVYDCSAPWYNMTPRPLSAAAAEGYCFQWHIPLQGLREALRSGAQPHAAFTVSDDDVAEARAGVALPCVTCRGLNWHVFIDCQPQRGGTSAGVAGVFVYCSVPAALRPAPEPGGAAPPCVGVVPGAGIRLGVYGWRCSRLEEVFVWTFGDDTYFVPEAGVGCPAALPLRRRPGSPANGGAEDAAGAWAEYLHEGGLRGSLTFLPP